MLNRNVVVSLSPLQAEVVVELLTRGDTNDNRVRLSTIADEAVRRIQAAIDGAGNGP